MIAGRTTLTGWPLLPALALCSCAARPPHTAPPAVVQISPVEVTTTYIQAYVHNFARGQYAIAAVCVAADGAIASVRIVESSTNHAFDEAAMQWAREAQYRPQLEDGQPVYGCREVRVEINPDPAPRVAHGADSAVG